MPAPSALSVTDAIASDLILDSVALPENFCIIESPESVKAGRLPRLAYPCSCSCSCLAQCSLCWYNQGLRHRPDGTVALGR